MTEDTPYTMAATEEDAVVKTPPLSASTPAQTTPGRTAANGQPVHLSVGSPTGGLQDVSAGTAAAGGGAGADGDGASSEWAYRGGLAAISTVFLGLVVAHTVASVNGAPEAVIVALKPLPVLVLIVLVLVRGSKKGYSSKVFAKGLVAGLVASATGDVLLDLNYFVPGLLAFLVAHLLYIVAFSASSHTPYHRPDSRWIPLKPVRAVPYATALVIVVVILWSYIDSIIIRVAFLVYAMAEGSMAWRTAARIGYAPKQWRSIESLPLQVCGCIGGALFVVSDSLIAFGKWFPGISHSGLGLAIMFTYWAAQALLAVSMPVLDGRHRRRSVIEYRLRVDSDESVV